LSTFSSGCFSPSEYVVSMAFWYTEFPAQSSAWTLCCDHGEPKVVNSHRYWGSEQAEQAPTGKCIARVEKTRRRDGCKWGVSPVHLIVKMFRKVPSKNLKCWFCKGDMFPGTNPNFPVQ
jgi:hypothetical protein